MLETLTLAALAYGTYRLLRRLPVSAPEPPASDLPAPAPPAPPTQAPRPFDYPLFTPGRGAVRTYQAEALRYLAARPGPMFDLAGVLWPTRDYLNKVSFTTGRPGSGKTVLMRMQMASVAALFPVLPAQARAGLYPGAGLMRWLVIDPTEAYLPLLYQVVPGDVPIVRATPHDAHGLRWDVAKDITSEADNQLLQAGLFPDTLFEKANDPFWYRKAREVTEAVVQVFHDRRSAWQFHDLIVPIRYPQFLKPLLRQSPRTVGKTTHELVGRLGRDIVSTSSSVVNRMAIAAALWRKAPGSFSLGDFLELRQVVHFGYTPDLIEGLAGIANALSFVLIRKALRRNDEYNHTLLWLDEARYLAAVTGLDDLAARGRGAGLGASISAQGTPGLLATWSEARVRELLDLALTWVTLSAGAETAEAFCRAVGKVEGVQKSYSFGRSQSVTETYGENWSSGSSGHSHGVSYSHATTSGSNRGQSFQLTTKEAVLPGEVTGLPLARRWEGVARGFAFNPDVGVFQFDAPYLHHFAALPDPPFDLMPRRPDSEQTLLPWNEDDVARLRLEPTADLVAAVKKTWKHYGGKQ